MNTPRVILASRSPRRRELLNLVGIAHEVRPADIDETYFAGERPWDHAERLAREKAAVIAREEPDAVVIGSDTIVVIDGDVLGKPADAAEARRVLRRLAARSHVVMTAVAVVWRGETRSGVEQVGVDFHPLTDAEIDANIAGIRRVFEHFLTFGEGPTDAVMVNNDDWLSKLEYVPFLRDVGRHFTINRMLTFDSVRLRLDREQPLTFLEFNYMILQAYDFLELSRRHGLRLQLGGSDQWGNIVNGIELTRRVEGTEVFGVTTPLITNPDGSKMGKTAQGAVWLNEEQLSAYDYWQFWRNTDDSSVGKFLRLFTDLPLEEVERLEALPGAGINEAKIVLATEATAMQHGREAASAAADTARATFEQGGSGDDLPTLSVGEGVSLAHALT
jgi:MAF protein